MPPPHRQDEALESLLEILRRHPALIVGTGASMALDIRFGMPALSTHLREDLPRKLSNQCDRDAWNEIERLMDQGADLEAAIDQVKLPQSLEDAIVAKTGGFVAGLDVETKGRLLREGLEFPLGNLIHTLLEFAPPAFPVLDIVTTNYDCLIEHTCDSLQLPVTTGFVGVLHRRFDWEKSSQHHIRVVPRNKHFVQLRERHVRLFKLHGSLDWFAVDNRPFTDYSLMYQDEWAAHRCIVTPGRTKTEKVLQGFSRDLLSHMDAELARADAYVFVGFGFNDTHIDDKLVNDGIRTKGKAGIIITRDLNDKARRHLQRCPNLWAVHKSPAGPHGTVISRGDHEEWSDPHQDLWQIDKFTQRILKV